MSMTRNQRRQRRKNWRNIFWIVLCIIVAFGAGYLANYLMPPVYM